MTPRDLKEANAQIILGGNTFHMVCSPGLEKIKSAGGMHKFMGWDGPMLTDSGGFQIFSLSRGGDLCKVVKTGGKFKDPRSGRTIHLTPEYSIEAQKIIGADIIMAFDQCCSDLAEKKIVYESMKRTHEWLVLSKEFHDKNPLSAYGYQQAFFGIAQGSYFKDLREESIKILLAQNVDGIAIGGEIIGFDMDKTQEIMGWVLPLIPENKARYTMGVGLYPQNLIDVVASGADMFDCVAPTRNARHGSLYEGKIVSDGDWIRFQSDNDNGRILIKKSIYSNDDSQIMDDCDCYTCRNFSRRYMHFLFKEKSLLFNNLACIHNTHVMLSVCSAMRKNILLA
jgi:queuine tRNA-ribosyltransferase